MSDLCARENSTGFLLRMTSLSRQPRVHAGARRGPHASRDRQSPKETQFNNLRLPRCDVGKFLEGFIQGKQFLGALHGDDLDFIENHFNKVRSSLFSSFRPGMVDENVTHQIYGGRKEIESIVQTRKRAIHESQIYFMHKCCWLKSMLSTLLAHTRGGDSS